MMSANLRAFLAVIRACEGTGDDNGYRALYGHTASAPKLFDSFADHPRIVAHTPWGWTSAAGAYQFLAVSPTPGGGRTKVNTWDRARAALELPDFSPESQDRAAVWLIQTDGGAGALADIEAGRLADALAKCAGIWASLPGSPHGQPTRTYDYCERVFVRAGGTLTQAVSGASGATPPPPATQPAAPPAPAPQPVEAAPLGEDPYRGETMPLPVPALIALGAELLKLVPWISKSAERAGRLEQAAPVLVEIAKTVAGPAAVNEQAAVEAVLKDRETQAQFTAAVAVRWSDVQPFLEHDARERAAARTFAETISAGDGWRAIGAGALIGALSLTIILGGGAMFWQLMDSPQLDPGQKGLILGALLSVFSSTAAFWFGSSASSRTKDQTINEQAKK